MVAISFSVCHVGVSSTYGMCIKCVLTNQIHVSKKKKILDIFEFSTNYSLKCICSFLAIPMVLYLKKQMKVGHAGARTNQAVAKAYKVPVLEVL